MCSQCAVVHVSVLTGFCHAFCSMNSKFLEMVTVHWYKATKESYNTPVTLLDEAPIRKEMDNLRALVQTSNSYGKPLRVAEMNTISNSGRVRRVQCVCGHLVDIGRVL